MKTLQNNNPDWVEGDLYTESGQILQGSFSAAAAVDRIIFCIEAKFCK